MKYKIVMASFGLLILFCQRSIAQKKFSNYECRNSWHYFNLEHSVTGTVISHQKPDFTCGYFATASITIIKIFFGDTIRVLELCNMDKFFLKGEIVKIEPAEKPDFYIDLPIQFYCAIKKTTFGVISNAK